jgi:hypothetical protein
MHNYFLTKVKYEQVSESGSVVKTTEQYVLDALSFTEAEARIIEEMKPFISGEFVVDTIKREKINEIFWNEKGDKWFKAKVFFITLDEDKGVEKETGAIMYIQANDIKEARENLEEGMKGTLADYRIGKIEETKVETIFKYEK